MKKIVVIGSEEIRNGFRLAGVAETQEPEGFEEKALELLESEDTGLVITEQEYLDEVSRKTRKRIDDSVNPVFVALSAEAESERLQEKIRQAIGADIT